jgi:hypothetical protein
MDQMKTVWPYIEALLLSLCIMLYGMVSDAGANSGAGAFEMVICSGSGPVTVVMDANGKPVKSPSPCCDCLTCTAPTTAFLAGAVQFDLAQSQFCTVTVVDTHQTPAPLIIAQPQARGPPLAPSVNGVRTMLRCGRVTKDATA